MDNYTEAYKLQCVKFVEHIRKHLIKENIPGKVMCKICKKTIDEILLEQE